MSLDDTYLNPVYRSSFPDPFVLKFRGEYFAYCTGVTDHGVFQVLRSADLVHWQSLGAAMDPLPTGEPFYWAPEVNYHNGKFYLYYSVGNEALMHLRVAVADRPDGDFVDSGSRLTSQEFAIDAHVFRDDDGRWFMFYATDFLDHSHIGTGTVIDRMLDPYTLTGDPRPVTRAMYDWQVYDPQRKEKGGVRWHTIEGPCVLKRKGAYYEMFSGGNWQNPSYGVSFAVSDDIDRNVEWRQHADGDANHPILSTLRGRVIGPGHNSVVRGPDNRELYCIYHQWVGDERVMAIDRLDFAGDDRLFLIGPTHTPQPAPDQPYISDRFNDPLTEPRRVISGEWQTGGGEIVSRSAQENEIEYDAGGSSFLCEVDLRIPEAPKGNVGIRLRSEDGEAFTFFLDAGLRQVTVDGPANDMQVYDLPDDLDLTSFHHLRVEADHRSVVISLDEVELVVRTSLPWPARTIALVAEGHGVGFSAFALTRGFEERFEDKDLGVRGWTIEGDGIAFENKNLVVKSEGGKPLSLSKPVATRDFELAVNIRLAEFNTSGLISFGCGRKITLRGPEPVVADLDGQDVVLPEGHYRRESRQFRMVQRGDRLDAYLEGSHLGTCAAGPADAIEITVENGAAFLDMVRFTSH